MLRRRSDEEKRLEEVCASVVNAAMSVTLGHMPMAYLSDIADGCGEAARQLFQSIVKSQGQKAAPEGDATRHPKPARGNCSGRERFVDPGQPRRELTRGALEPMTVANLS
jgi:hypothetical protein